MVVAVEQLKAEYWKEFAIAFGEKCSNGAAFQRASLAHCSQTRGHCRLFERG